MRVQVIFTTSEDEKAITITKEKYKSYKSDVMSFFYECIEKVDKKLAKKLHDVGYAFGNKIYKPFTYSNFRSDKIIYRKDTITYLPKFYLQVSSFYDEIVLAFIRGIININAEKRLHLFNKKLFVKRIQLLSENIPNTERITIRTFSPIVVSKNVNGKKTYLSPYETEFSEIINMHK